LFKLFKIKLVTSLEIRRIQLTAYYCILFSGSSLDTRSLLLDQQCTTCCLPTLDCAIQKTVQAPSKDTSGALTLRDLTTRYHVPFADFAFPVRYALMSRKTTELYVKVFQRVQQLVPQFAPTCATADFEEASMAGFFLNNRLCQITVQTFSNIIVTFPSANTYMCC